MKPRTRPDPVLRPLMHVMAAGLWLRLDPGAEGVSMSPVAGDAADASPGPPPEMVTPPSGLNDVDVSRRIAAGQTNATDVRTSRSRAQIVRANVLTVFNRAAGCTVRPHHGDPTLAERVVRGGDRRERRDRDRSGVAGETDPRPAGPGQRAARTGGPQRLRPHLVLPSLRWFSVLSWALRGTCCRCSQIRTPCPLRCR